MMVASADIVHGGLCGDAASSAILVHVPLDRGHHSRGHTRSGTTSKWAQAKTEARPKPVSGTVPTVCGLRTF